MDEAASGREALAKLAAGWYDLVILDLMLLGIDGWEVCRRVRQVSQVPILMLTARGAVADRGLGLNLEADDNLPKPFDPWELVARVRAILRRAGAA